MSRNILTLIAVIIVVLAVILHVHFVSTTGKEARDLMQTVALMEDSLSLLQKVVDSLKAQTPGLGDYMSTIQLHTAKLWFAAQAANWKLARYEHDELEETIEAAEALHAKKNDVDITVVLQSVRRTQLPLVEQAIAGRNLRAFNGAYDQTLAACNGCHRPAGYEFIHIITPTREPVTNQQWRMDSP